MSKPDGEPSSKSGPVSLEAATNMIQHEASVGVSSNMSVVHVLKEDLILGF